MSDEPTPYASTGTPFSSKLADLLRGEPARHDDAHPLVAGRVERVAHLPDEPLVHAGRLEVAHLVEERAVDERLRRVEPHAPEPVAERVRDLERRAHRVVLEVDEHRDVHVGRRPLGELLRREHGVAAVRRDQRVRHRADAAAAPPRRLLVVVTPISAPTIWPATYAA